MTTPTPSPTGPDTSAATRSSAAALVERLSPRTLLTVWAHPDDESYLGGGLMATAAAAGVRVVNVTATLGEHGTDDPDRFPPEALGRIRRQELSGALAALGVDESMTLGYGDGTCAEVADQLGARRIATILDTVDPDVVLTFGPDGVTGHPDHRAVARWVAAAVAARPSPTALITTAVGECWPADLVAGMARVGAFWPGFPHRHCSAPRYDVAMAPEVIDRKLRALHAHRSQIGPVRNELGPAGYRRLAAAEAYRPANQIASQLLSGLGARGDAAA